MKELKDISWLVTEEEYRSDKALSYSTLAKYEREGFSNLEHLFDKTESPSLLLGSCVDSIVTGGKDEFDSRFMVADFPQLSDSIVEIIKALFENFRDTYHDINEIPDNIIIPYTTAYKFQLNWRPETRARVIKEKGYEYYSLMYLAKDRTIVSTEMYKDVLNMTDALKTSEATSFYFAPDNPFDDVRRYYQLKFKASFNGINYRCMADLLLCNYSKKVIIPVDLKTSYKPEYEFYKSFIDWGYDIQARLYYAIIRKNLDKDEYFKDFKLENYRFIVVNRKTLNPLVWVCPFTESHDTVRYGKEGKELRSPFVIGEELDYYLSSDSKVPVGINETGLNDIYEWINKL